MLLFLGMLVSLVAAATGQTSCTLGNEWSVKMSNVPSIAAGDTKATYWYYDFNTGQQAILEFDFSISSSTPQKRVVQNFILGTKSTIKADGACRTVSSGNQPMLRPDFPTTDNRATYLGQSYVGDQSISSSLDTEAWRLPIDGIDSIMVVAITSNTPQCVPILQGVASTSGTGTIKDVLFFTDYVPGPVDQAMFSVPEEC